MGFTDSQVMGPEAHRTTDQLRAAVLALESAQDKAGTEVIRAADDGHLVGFSTSLTDDDRKYLDLCAELYSRGESRRKPCSEEPQPQS